MRSRDAKRGRAREKIKQKQAFGFSCAGIFLCLLAACFSAGCVRVAGTSGYWHANEEDGIQAKRVGFDTAALASKDQDQGRITV
jgi:hypothetical protein